MEFPRWVYKRGTGRKVDDSGMYTAESALVGSAEELAALGHGWCDSPVEAGTSSAPEEKHEAVHVGGHHKKVK